MKEAGAVCLSVILMTTATLMITPLKLLVPRHLIVTVQDIVPAHLFFTFTQNIGKIFHHNDNRTVNTIAVIQIYNNIYIIVLGRRGIWTDHKGRELIYTHGAGTIVLLNTVQRIGHSSQWKYVMTMAMGSRPFYFSVLVNVYNVYYSLFTSI